MEGGRARWGGGLGIDECSAAVISILAEIESERRERASLPASSPSTNPLHSLATLLTS